MKTYNSLTIEIVKERIKNINPDIEILDDKYENNYTPLKCRCKVHNYIWYIRWGNLQQGQGCTVCRTDKNSRKNNASWNGGVTNLNKYIRKITLKQWRKDFINNNKKCIIANQEYDLVMHHIVPLNKIIDRVLKNLKLEKFTTIGEYSYTEVKKICKEVLDIHNSQEVCVMISNDYHKKFHREYGNAHFTKKDWNEFLKNNKGGKNIL